MNYIIVIAPTNHSTERNAECINRNDINASPLYRVTEQSEHHISRQMGIPSYFSHIIRNYPNILRNLAFFVNSQTTPFHHLFMDCNSIIYDAVYSLQKEGVTQESMETEIISRTIEKIKVYIRMIKPTKTVYIAFDGVAPFAKMEQQRTRRYKSRFMAMQKKDAGSTWNTSNITPGTAFMEKLSYHMEHAFQNKEIEYGVKSILVSCSNQPGEGEHKLYEYMRTHDMSTDAVAVYGLDADLIMLSIFHLCYCDNIYVFREAPEFMKSSIPVETKTDDNAPYFLDIKHLSSSILAEMNCKANDPQRIYDYVFLCFFLGNDFLPHFPAMNIRTHGIQALLDIYRLHVGNFPDRFFISKKNGKESGKIQWKNVGLFVEQIAKSEREFLKQEYDVRNKFDKRRWPETTDLEKEDLLLNAPVIYRQQEKYICPDEPYWEERYYKTLFHVEKTPDTIKKVCVNYMEGLEWVFAYYTSHCPDWHWKYNYHYPPLFSDLRNYVPHFEMNFIQERAQTNASFLPQTQLAYVLPAKDLNLLPKKIEAFLTTNYEDLYPETYDLQWAFCRYLWEAHPDLPDIPLELLKQWDTQFRMHIQ